MNNDYSVLILYVFILKFGQMCTIINKMINDSLKVSVE